MGDTRTLRVEIQIVMETKQKEYDHRSCDHYRQDLVDQIVELMNDNFSDEFEKITVRSDCNQFFLKKRSKETKSIEVISKLKVV